MNRKITSQVEGITEIVGTMLLLLIAVTLFSTVYFSVLSLSPEPITPSANIVGNINDKKEIVMEHFGGSSLPGDTKLLLSLDGSSVPLTVESFIEDTNHNDKWDMGEYLVIDSYDLLNKQVTVTIVDQTSNSIVMTSIIQERPSELLDPFVTTGRATQITSDSTNLKVEYNFRGLSGTVYFKYKKDGDPTWTVSDEKDLSGHGSHTQEITNLESDSTYVYQAVLKYNTSQYKYGEIKSFTTKPLTIETEINDISFSPASPNSILLSAISTGEANPDYVTLYYRWSNNNFAETSGYNWSNCIPHTNSGVSYSNAEDNCGSTSPSGEEHPKAFDDNLYTKWLDFCGDDGTSWIQYDYGIGKTHSIAKYEVSSADDIPNRDPKDWYLEGSNDNNSWTKIDRQTEIDFPERYQTKTFNIDDENVSEYRWYRLNITDISNAGSANSVQLSEIELYECEELSQGMSTDWMIYTHGINPDENAPWTWTFNFTHGYGYYEFYSIGRNNTVDNEDPPTIADASFFISFDDFYDKSESLKTTGNFTGSQDIQDGKAYGLSFSSDSGSHVFGWTIGLRNNSGAYWKLNNSISAEANEYSQIIVKYNWSVYKFDKNGYWSFEYYNESSAKWEVVSNYSANDNDFQNKEDSGSFIEWLNESEGFELSDNFNVRFVCQTDNKPGNKDYYQLLLDNIYIIAVRK